MNIFKNIIDKVVDAFSSSKELKMNDYDETNYDDKIVACNEILETKYDDKIVPYNEILESKNGILIALLSKIAKSDGVISVNESNYISKQIDSFQIKEEIRHIYSEEIINQEKDNTSNIQELCRNLLGLDENESKIFIKNLVDITKVDNKFYENQYKILSDIMTFINLPEDSIKEFQIELLEKPNEECKKLYQKLYILKLEKEDIESKIEEIEYRAFKTYGKIKLELLSLKKDISKKCMDEYKNYLKIYDKYENYKNNKRPILEDEVFNNICKLNILEQKIDYCKSEISNLERNIEELKKNEFLRIGDKIQYLMLEKELLNEELESIQNKRQNKTKIIVVTEDIELKKLKQKLKRLETKFQQLIEEKTEYLNDIEEFNTQYSLHLGELIRTILNLKKEILYKRTIKNQKLKKHYKANKDICDETKQTIDELKNTVSELEEILENIDKDDENYEEISSAYNEIKEELEKLEDELILQEEKLEKTEEELKENEIFEEEYEDAKATYEQFDDEYEHIKDTQKDVIKLDEEQQKELKILFKKAAKLCHPDIVADELKEKALEIMQSLNDAYSKKDIEQVKKILLNLESGTTFKTVSSDIEDKELLLNKIKEFEQNISDLKDEIKTLKDDDTFTTILQVDNWDEYFEELKNELTEQKANLEKEAMEVLAEKEEIEEWIQKLWDWADENNISNGKLSRKKEKLLAMSTIDFTGLKLKNICKEIFNLKNVTTFSLWDNDISFLPNEIVNFTNLKKLNLRGNPNLAISPNQKEWIEALRGKCSVFIDSVKYITEETLEIQIDKYSSIKTSEILEENSDYSKYIKSIENIKFEKIRKYCENLSKDNRTDDMQKYLAQNGKMYKALIYDALEQFISKLDNQTITLVDWGSNQGIASMLVLDYIKEKQLDIKVSQVILVDDDTKILSRAMAQVEALSQDNIQIISIKNDDDNLLDKIKTNRNTIALNLFANDKIPIDVKVINDGIYEDFIMCLSHENIEFVDKIYNDFNNSTNIQDLSIRDGNIGRYQRYERIFKI